MRISGVVSMRRLPAGKASSTLGRVRWFRGSREVHTEQSHPRTGTPVDVPVPRKISRRAAVGLSINRINLQDAGNTVWPGRFSGCLGSPARNRLVPFYEKPGRSATRAGLDRRPGRDAPSRSTPQHRQQPTETVAPRRPLHKRRRRDLLPALGEDGDGFLLQQACPCSTRIAVCTVTRAWTGGSADAMKSISRRTLLGQTSLLGSARAVGLPLTATTDPARSDEPEDSRRKLKVIVTGGHPGDPEYGCGGTIARYTD